MVIRYKIFLYVKVYPQKDLFQLLVCKITVKIKLTYWTEALVSYFGMAKSTVIIRFHIYIYILDLLSSLVSILKTIVRRCNLSNSYNQIDTWQRVCPRALLFNLTIIIGEQGLIQSGDPKLIKFQWEKFFTFNTNFFWWECDFFTWY